MLSRKRFAARAGPVILPSGERFAPGAPGERSTSLWPVGPGLESGIAVGTKRFPRLGQQPFFRSNGDSRTEALRRGALPASGPAGPGGIIPGSPRPINRSASPSTNGFAPARRPAFLAVEGALRSVEPDKSAGPLLSSTSQKEALGRKRLFKAKRFGLNRQKKEIPCTG